MEGSTRIILKEMMKITADNKLSICKYYARGYCARGSTCFYSHSQIPPLPQSCYSSEDFFHLPDLTSICPSFSEGFCSKGFNCSLKHIYLGPDQVLCYY
jgi:hypothetical protein